MLMSWQISQIREPDRRAAHVSDCSGNGCTDNPFRIHFFNIGGILSDNSWRAALNGSDILKATFSSCLMFVFSEILDSHILILSVYPMYSFIIDSFIYTFIIARRLSPAIKQCGFKRDACVTPRSRAIDLIARRNTFNALSNNQISLEQ